MWQLFYVFNLSKNVKLSLGLIKLYAVKTHEGAEAQLHVFLNSTLDKNEWLASRPGALPPRKEPWYMLPRARVGAVKKRESLHQCRILKSDFSAVHPAA
jgi:hypothetical protein